MRARTLGLVGLIAGGLVLMLPSPAHAYIDAGSGSYFFQLLIGGVLGGLLALKLFWKRIWTSIFRRPRSKTRD